ncbi:T9SS type A sorting domain-containing protein [Marinirhabdus gelatinilytica]|uniref:Putative secreted protein (Por secretion system target) n=1 Tax=Marinirhabdus gelatinilytica TaxID=1703343 RepID=A0A370QKE9_9FLAO|nr:T9SS type A sorting domain-containing protein [Marinirhabdus gelatinilytica]RDK88844.1 putative secreted protein (Por secretion system target) [Marinirhabdus gelatinilytica]
MKKITLLLLVLITAVSFGQNRASGVDITINEIDADQDGTDAMEFIEIKTSTPNTALDGYVVVLFNGSDDASYNAIDLDGFTTDANGYFILGGTAVPGVDIDLGANNVVQNGADAVAIYVGDDTDFPTDTPATTTNLVDALVYGTSDPDDTDLLAALGETVQYDENLNGNGINESIQQRPDGTYCIAAPTLDADNVCPSCTFAISNTTIECDTSTANVDTVTISMDFVGGGTETYTITITAGSGTVGGDDPTSNATGTIEITDVDEETMITVNVSSTSCDEDFDITAPACEPALNAATIADLRAAGVGATVTLVGEAILTFQQDFRNQKFIEDDTAAILIDDDNGVITTEYMIGDGITTITGEVTEFGGMLQFVPEADTPPASSTGNPVVPQAVSIAELLTNPEEYEAEYVQIVQGVDIVIGGDPNWQTGTEYPLTNPDGTFNFRTSFFDADYIGLPIPVETVDLAGIITERDNGSYFITSRNQDDVNGDVTLGTNEFDQNNFAVYPNPTNGNYITIASANNAEMNVAIYDVTGKIVVNTVTNSSVDITALNSGIYLVKITQDGVTATQKLIVR